MILFKCYRYFHMLLWHEGCNERKTKVAALSSSYHFHEKKKSYTIKAIQSEIKLKN